MASIAVEGRYTADIDATVALSPVVLSLPAGKGPFRFRLISGTAKVEASISSAQNVLDDSANWWEVAASATGLQDPVEIDDAQALRFTATADAVFEVLGR